jgi:cytochrome oxidase Cu insertion factor (SCO1/SenC/PrrC family)
MVSRNFDTTQALLSRLDLAGECRLLSISLDAGHDTPAVLAAYASGWQANPDVWIFAGAPEEAVRAFGTPLGLVFKRVDGRIDHNLRTVVVDRAGRVSHLFRGDGWTPQELAAELRAAAKRR